MPGHAEGPAKPVIPMGCAMKLNCKKRMIRFLRDLEPEHDTFKITILTLSALINSLKSVPASRDCPPKEFKNSAGT